MRDRGIYKFCLYVAGDAENSSKAIANITALCRTRWPKRYEIEVVDVFRHPARALREHVLMTPTLVKVSPSPSCRIVGTLSRADTVCLALGVDSNLP